MGALYGVWLAWLAHTDLVTLSVRNTEVRDVVKIIERQTWEDIFVEKSVQGKVTLNVRRMPLMEVLRRVGEQTAARSSSIYPLYSNRQSLDALKQSLRGEVDAAAHGWTNLQTRMFGPGPGGMAGFGMMMPVGPGQDRSGNHRVSLAISGKDLSFAILALSRFAQARVVPEDGTSALIQMTVKQATVGEAVGKLAKAAHRKWTRVYALQPMFGPGGPGGPEGPGGGPRQFAFRPDGPRDFPPGGGEMNAEKRDELGQRREALEEELKQVLPAEERQKLDRERQAREQQMQEFASMTPEQRRERMPDPAEMARMQRERLLNSTPEQRAEMSRRRAQMRPPGPPR